MFVLNHCTNDARVLKEAEALGRAGYDVDIIAIASEVAPDYMEEKEYFRIFRVQPRAALFYLKRFELSVKALMKRQTTPSRTGRADKVSFKKNVTVQPLPLNSVKEPTPSPSQEGNTKSPLLGGDLGVGELLQKNLLSFPAKIFKKIINKVFQRYHRLNTYGSYWLKAKKLAESLKADIYHAHDLNTLIPAYWAAKKTNAKTVYDSHELFTEIQIWGRIERYFYRKLEAFIIKRVDKVITINNSIAGELVKRYHIEYPKVIVNCPPPLKRGEANAYDSVLRNAAGIPLDKRLVLYQGGFTQYRGLEELIEAFTYLDESFCLVFMGYGKIRNELEVIVYSKGLNNRIKFLPAVPQIELLKYTSSADLGVIPYKPVSLNNYYTLPNKLFEYINAGIPIIASDLPELRRIIKGYDIGYLFDPYKSESIADAIKYVFSDKERYAAIKANTSKAAGEYNWNKESKKLLECYSLL